MLLRTLWLSVGAGILPNHRRRSLLDDTALLLKFVGWNGLSDGAASLPGCSLTSEDCESVGCGFGISQGLDTGRSSTWCAPYRFLSLWDDGMDDGGRF